MKTNPTDDAIARSKRVLEAVDAYHARPDSLNRTALRVLLMGEFEELLEAAKVHAPRPDQSERSNQGETPHAPSHCPVTGMKFWGNIDHPKLGVIATYGGPLDTYTTPARGEDGELRSEHFDQDRNEWVDSEPMGWFYTEQQAETCKTCESCS